MEAFVPVPARYQTFMRKLEMGRTAGSALVSDAYSGPLLDGNVDLVARQRSFQILITGVAYLVIGQSMQLE